MPVLILAIASFVVFAMIVVLLCIADTLESRATRHKTRPALANSPALFTPWFSGEDVVSARMRAPGIGRNDNLLYLVYNLAGGE